MSLTGNFDTPGKLLETPVRRRPRTEGHKIFTDTEDSGPEESSSTDESDHKQNDTQAEQNRSTLKKPAPPKGRNEQTTELGKKMFPPSHNCEQESPEFQKPTPNYQVLSTGSSSSS